MEGRTAVPWGQNRSGDSLRWAPTLQRATSVPDVLGGETKAGFSSITITSRKVSNTHIYQSHETLHPHAQPHQVSTARLLTKSPALSSESTKSSKSALEIQRASILKVTEDRQGSSIFDRVLMRGAGRKRAGLPEYRYSYTEGHKSQDAGQSSRSLPPLHSFRSCLHLEVPPVSSSSVLFLNKSLSISLGQAEDGSSRVHRSTLSLSVGRTPHHRSPKTNPQTDCRISRVKQECTWKLDNQRADSGHSGGHALQRWGCEILRVTCSDGANRQSTDSDTQRSTPRLLSFREPGLSYTGASWQNGNADEKCYPPFSNFRHKHPTCNVNPGRNLISTHPVANLKYPLYANSAVFLSIASISIHACIKSHFQVLTGSARRHRGSLRRCKVSFLTPASHPLIYTLYIVNRKAFPPTLQRCVSKCRRITDLQQRHALIIALTPCLCEKKVTHPSFFSFRLPQPLPPSPPPLSHLHPSHALSVYHIHWFGQS